MIIIHKDKIKERENNCQCDQFLKIVNKVIFLSLYFRTQNNKKKYISFIKSIMYSLVRKQTAVLLSKFNVHAYGFPNAVWQIYSFCFQSKPLHFLCIFSLRPFSFRSLSCFLFIYLPIYPFQSFLR